jgi:hypothetical protein
MYNLRRKRLLHSEPSFNQCHDMSTNFLGSPSELRNKIYAQLVVDQESIDPWANGLSKNHNEQSELACCQCWRPAEPQLLASAVVYARLRSVSIPRIRPCALPKCRPGGLESFKVTPGSNRTRAYSGSRPNFCISPLYRQGSVSC